MAAIIAVLEPVRGRAPVSSGGIWPASHPGRNGRLVVFGVPVARAVVGWVER